MFYIDKAEYIDFNYNFYHYLHHLLIIKIKRYIKENKKE